MATEADDPGALDTFRQVAALPRDVFVLSVAMFAFSLGFQMTARYLPEYMRVLGAGPLVVGLYKSLGDLIGAVYPYPGGAVSDRIGSRYALTLFGLVSAAGFAVWALAPSLSPTVGGLTVPAWVWLFPGLMLAQAWKSLGLGATFAVVKQSVAPRHLAAGFASTETFRRVGFLIGPLLAVAVLTLATDFVAGFRVVLAIAVGVALLATAAQHLLYDAGADTGGGPGGLAGVREDLRGMPAPLRPLLLGDTLVRFGNGMVYAFVVFVVTDIWELEATLLGVALGPAALFGVFLAVEMAVALVTMAPAARAAERVGLKPVVAAGFLVYATFPLVLISAPPDPLVVGAVFAFSGLRFAGLPAHKALIVGPARDDAGGRVTGSYYLVRNAVTIPAGVVGGWLYGLDRVALAGVAVSGPGAAFGVATAVGLLGTALFVARGEEFAAYA